MSGSRRRPPRKSTKNDLPDAPRDPPGAPREGQERPKRRQEAPRRLQEGPKSRQEPPQEPLRGALRGAWAPPWGCQCAQEVPGAHFGSIWPHVGSILASFWVPFLLRFWPLQGSCSGSHNFAFRRDALHTLLFASFKELELRSLNFGNLEALDPSSPGWPPGVAKRLELFGNVQIMSGFSGK